MRLSRPVDAASLAAFRVLYGTLMAVAMLRLLGSGWLEEMLVRPTFFFKYQGFEWVPVWGPSGLYWHVGLTAACAVLVALGLLYRVAILGFVVGFAGLQLMDQTNYLNHYYLVVLLGLILCVVPAHRVASLDARLWPKVHPPTVPAWTLMLLRFQVGCVYVFAAFAKLTPDWLLHGQPLEIWMSARAEATGIELLAAPFVPLAMSWAGFLYDASITALLLWRRTRPLAYAAVVVFHVSTWLLFDIGMFPFIMIVSTTVFFGPSWPRRWLRWPAPEQTPDNTPSSPRRQRLVAPLLTLWCLFHVAFPLRHYAMEGDVLWNERGMRWAWKVLVRAKSGAVTYHVTDPASGRRFVVSPAKYLQPRQESEMSGQPDMIWQLAHHIRADFADKGYPEVAVSAEAWVSLNGRPKALLLDPTADLTRLGQDTLAAAILPAPTTLPVGRP